VKYPNLFDQLLETIKKKQLLYIGDRSASELRQIDALIGSLTYEDWRKDVMEAEDRYLKYPLYFQSHIDEMKRKQAVLESGSPKSKMMPREEGGF
jgi:hypothetical protein